MKILNNVVEENIYDKKLKDILGFYIKGAEAAYFFDSKNVIIFEEDYALPYTLPMYKNITENSTIEDFLIEEFGEVVRITKVFYSEDDFSLELKF